VYEVNCRDVMRVMRVEVELTLRHGRKGLGVFRIDSGGYPHSHGLTAALRGQEQEP
jgi:hypothetical protein